MSETHVTVELCEPIYIIVSVHVQATRQGVVETYERGFWNKIEDSPNESPSVYLWTGLPL